MHKIIFIKSLILSSFLLSHSEVFAQDSVYVDPRDGQVYGLLDFGPTIWFSSNLKYISPTSWCAEEGHEEDCIHGNYYFNTELDSLCPSGWHVSTWQDWQDAMPDIAYSIGVHPDSIRKNENGIYYEGIDLLNDSLGLKLYPTGWIQGKRKRKREAADIWALDPRDDRTHLHIAHHHFLIHAHDEYVHDKPRRNRRFSIRCVKNRE